MRMFFLLILLTFIAGSLHAQDSHLAPEDRILAWVAPGSRPGTQTASEPGEVVFIDADGNLETVFDVPLGTARVHACGNEATSPDGRLFALYVGGNDAGNLVMMRDASPNTTLLVQDLSTLTCTGNGTFQYAPNSERFGYLLYPANYGLQDSPVARLYVHNSADFGLLRQFDNVAAFDIADDVIAVVSFFTNRQRQATEVGFIVDDGNIDREVATLFADERCFYTSASVDVMADGKLASVLGYRCTVGDGRTRWQFYVIDPATFSATLIASDVAGGTFFSGARTNNVFGAPNSTVIFFTVPDGISTYTTGVRVIDVATSESRLVFPDSAILPRVTVPPYQKVNRPTVVSPDGNYLAIVRNDPNNRVTLTVIDLARHDLPPIEIPMPNRGMLIGEMLFTADNERLIYTVGTTDNEFNNSLFALNLQTGAEQRLRRGSYGYGVLSPEGDVAVISNWFILNVDAPPIYGVVSINLQTTEELPLFIGAEVIDGKLENQRFAYPLAWRRQP